MQENVRTTSVLRFAVYGAVGFGIGGAIAGTSGDAMLLGFFVMGALGGASLGLATSDRRRTGALALTGALGFGTGFFVAFAIVLLVWEPPLQQWFIGTVGGAVGGASLAVLFGTWRGTVLLAVAGGLGFGAGWGAVDVLSQPLIVPGASGITLWWAMISMTIEGVIGGGVLGAALGHLESRKPTAERRPGVR